MSSNPELTADSVTDNARVMTNVLTDKGPVKKLLGLTKLGLAVAGSSHPVTALLGMTAALGLNFAEKFFTQKSTQTSSEPPSLDEVLGHLRSLVQNEKELKSLILSDRAEKYAVKAVEAIRSGAAIPHPPRELAPYLQLFRLTENDLQSLAAAQAGIESLRQTVIGQESDLLQQRPAPGITETQLDALTTLLTAHCEDLKKDIQDASQASQLRDEKTHNILREQGAKADQVIIEQQEQRKLLEQLITLQTAPGNARPEETTEERRERVLQEMAEEHGKTAEWLKEQINLFVLHTRENPEADDHTRALAEFAAQSYANASRLALLSAAIHRGRREAREKHLAKQANLIEQEKGHERRDLTLAADAEFTLGHWRVAETLYRQALALTQQETDWEAWTEPAWGLAVTLRQLRMDTDAESLISSLLKEYTIREGPESRNVIVLTTNLANILSLRGDWKSAEPLYRHARALSEHILGLEHPDTLNSIYNLANMLRDQGNGTEARSLSSHVLKARERVLGAEHPHTLLSLNSMANELSDRGDWTEARLLFKRVLEARGRILGPEHPHTLTTHSCFALLLRRQGDQPGAEILCRRILETRERSLGENHPDTLDSRNNLANLLIDRNEWREAQALYRRVLKTRKRIFGPTHPDTLSTLNNLASVFRVSQNWSRAERLYSLALKIQERILGPEHPRTLDSLNNLAALLHERGDWYRSEPLSRRALETKERVLGPDHPDTLGSLSNLANLLSDRGDRNEAEALHRRALETRERALGMDHPDTLGSLNNLALLLRGRGDTEEAESLYRRAMVTMERVLGPQHPGTLTAMHNLAVLLSDKMEYREALTLMERAVEGRTGKLGPLHPNTLAAVHNLAVLLFGKWEYPGAFRAMERAVTGRKAKLGLLHPDTIQSAVGLELIRHEMKGL